MLNSSTKWHCQSWVWSAGPGPDFSHSSIIASVKGHFAPLSKKHEPWGPALFPAEPGAFQDLPWIHFLLTDNCSLLETAPDCLRLSFLKQLWKMFFHNLYSLQNPLEAYPVLMWFYRGSWSHARAHPIPTWPPPSNNHMVMGMILRIVLLASTHHHWVNLFPSTPVVLIYSNLLIFSFFF